MQLIESAARFFKLDPFPTFAKLIFALLINGVILIGFITYMLVKFFFNCIKFILSIEKKFLFILNKLSLFSISDSTQYMI